ncbi:unnamed protein product, partial [Ectocarpus sp. 4 AP-2014]
METLEQKKRRLYGKSNLKEYLKELAAITKINVSKKDLLSIVESDKITFHSDGKSYKAKVLFNNKERLLIFIGDLLELKD